MEDVQNHRDDRNIPIDRVGVEGLRYPISVLDPRQETQLTTAVVSLSVSLPHHFKGTHMSRFVEVLNEHRGEVTIRTVPKILRDLKQRLEAESAYIGVRFPYFMEKQAPVSRAKALIDYECTFLGQSDGGNDDFVLRVSVPVKQGASEWVQREHFGSIRSCFKGGADKAVVGCGGANR